MRTVVTIFVAAALVSIASWSFAGETESDTFFARGRELRLKGNCRDAIEEFRKAYDAYPEGLGALRNVAECEQELKRPASARRSWWALRTAVLQSQSEKYLGWEKDAEKAFADLAPSVAKLVVRVKNAPDPHIVINGRPLTPSLLGTELEQDLGDVVVVLEDGSAVPPSKKLTLEAGQRYEVELEATGQRTGGNPKPVTPPSGPSPLIISGGVGLGLAGLALGGLIGSIVVRQGALSTIEDACPGLTNCDPSLQDERDKGQTASTLFTAFAIGGGIAAAAGLGLLIAGVVTKPKPESKASEHALNLLLAPAPSGGFIGVRSTF